MAWGTVQGGDVVGITKATPQVTAVQALAPGELAHVTVGKTDAGVQTKLLVFAQGRIDAAESWGFLAIPGMPGSQPLEILPGGDPVSFALSGLFEFRLFLVAEDDVETLTARAVWKVDGVDLAP